MINAFENPRQGQWVGGWGGVHAGLPENGSEVLTLRNNSSL